MKRLTMHEKLSLKEIIKRHTSNPQDKDLHTIIGNEGNSDLKERFSKVIRAGAKQKPFDKKK